MKKYNVALSNDSAIFDSMDGFGSVCDALEWASGRGGKYVIQLAKEVNGVEVDFVSIAATTQRGKTTYAYYNICAWENVTAEAIGRMI